MDAPPTLAGYGAAVMARARGDGTEAGTRPDLAERRLDPESAALVIVDVQHLDAARDAGLGKELSDAGEYALVAQRYDRIESVVIPNIRRLLERFRRRDWTVFHLTIGSRTVDASDAPPHMREVFRRLGGLAGRPEGRILDEVSPLPGEVVLNKTTIDAFASTNIDSELRNRGITSLLIGGVATSVCVAATARSAAERGYSVAVVEDACGDTFPDDHRWALDQFRRLYGRVVTAEDVWLELGSPRP